MQITGFSKQGLIEGMRLGILTSRVEIRRARGSCLVLTADCLVGCMNSRPGLNPYLRARLQEVST